MSHEFEKAKFDRDLNIDAQVGREEMPVSELITHCHHALIDIGRAIGASDPSVGRLTYGGSFATHIFVSSLVEKDGTPKLVFAHQTATLGTTNELIAGAAGQDCLKAIARRYGRKPPAKRSGF